LSCCDCGDPESPTESFNHPAMIESKITFGRSLKRTKETNNLMIRRAEIAVNRARE
jgi:hypothetical protein